MKPIPEDNRRKLLLKFLKQLKQETKHRSDGPRDEAGARKLTEGGLEVLVCFSEMPSTEDRRELFLQHMIKVFRDCKLRVVSARTTRLRHLGKTVENRHGNKALLRFEPL